MDKSDLFLYFIHMKKKLILLFCLFAITIISCYAEVFSDYDFTFYKTISQTLTSFDSNKIGLDYTGFGFIGKQANTGLFIRFGFQTPFSFIKQLENRFKFFKEEENNLQNNEINPIGQDVNMENQNTELEEKKEEINTQQFSLTYIMGPAARLFTSNYINAYLGIGVRISQLITLTNLPLENQSIKNYNTAIGFDLDVGGKIDINERTSLRIGIYLTSNLMSFNYVEKTKTDGKDIKKEAEFATVFFDLINPTASHPPLISNAYISMGTHFTSNYKKKNYRYEITSPKLFKGKIIVLDDNQ